MEPVSTLVLAVAFLATAPATRINIWEKPDILAEKRQVSRSGTNYSLPTASVSDLSTFTRLADISGLDVSPREYLKQEVSEYSRLEHDWSGTGVTPPSRAAIDATLQFIDLIPARLPLPRPMISSWGEIGLYWDFAVGYAETSFDLSGAATFFSRDENGSEQFNEAIAVTGLTSAWFWNAIGPLDSELPAAA